MQQCLRTLPRVETAIEDERKMKKNKIIIIVAITAICIIVAGVLYISGSNSAARLDNQLKLANKYLREGQYEESILAFEKAIQIDPKNVDARLGLAKAYVAVGRTDDAITVLEEAMGIDAKRPEPYIELAEIYISRGEYEKAIEILEQGLLRVDAAKTGDIKRLLDELQDKLEPETDAALPESSGYAKLDIDWVDIDPQYHDICEEILALFETQKYDQIPAYMRENLVKPLREEKMSEDEKIVMYYGDVKDGVFNGKGLCIYSKGIKDKTEGYVGEFIDGMRSGTGLAIYTSRYYQGYYCGGWYMDTPHGNGTEFKDFLGEEGISDGIYDYEITGNTDMGYADGLWLEMFLDEYGSTAAEDNNEDNGITLAGYQYLCEDGHPVPFGDVSQDAWWIGVDGYGINSDPGKLMAKAYIVYEDGTEVLEDAPHEHAGGVGCRICRENDENGQRRAFHAWEPDSEAAEVYGFFIQ